MVICSPSICMFTSVHQGYMVWTHPQIDPINCALLRISACEQTWGVALQLLLAMSQQQWHPTSMSFSAALSSWACYGCGCFRDYHGMCGISTDPSLCFVVCQCFKKINRVSVCSDPWNRGPAPLVPTEVLVITGHRRWPSWRPWHGSGCESLGYRRRLGHIGYLKILKRSFKKLKGKTWF